MSEEQKKSEVGEERRAWVFTFGVGSDKKGKFVELYGTSSEARNEMFRLFDKYWAFQYSSREKAGVDMWGLVRLRVDSPLDLDSQE